MSVLEVGGVEFDAASVVGDGGGVHESLAVGVDGEGVGLWRICGDVNY